VSEWGQDSDETMKRILPLLLVVGLLPQTGCTHKETPFLGVPENGTRKVEDENPGIDSRLRGTVTMTAVQEVDYQKYLVLKGAGNVRTEQRRDGMLYFAVVKSVRIPLAKTGPDAASVVNLWITERYKTKARDETLGP
jgi:hypothetical protein